MKSKLKAFSIVELMALLALVSILAIIAMPAYESHAKQQKIGKAMSALVGVKSAVIKFYREQEAFPVSNSQAGLKVPSEYAGNYIAAISLGVAPAPGTITVELKVKGLGSANRIQLVPSYNGKVFTWVCQPAAVNGVKPNFLPSRC